MFRSSHPDLFLGKGVLKICSKFTGEHPTLLKKLYWKLLCNFIEITFRRGCSPVKLLHAFRPPFLKNTSERLLLYIQTCLISCSSAFLVGSKQVPAHWSSSKGATNIGWINAYYLRKMLSRKPSSCKVQICSICSIQRVKLIKSRFFH